MAAEDGLLEATTYLSANSAASDVESVLLRTVEAALTPIAERRVLDAIKRRTRHSISDLRQQMAPLKRALLPLRGPSWISQIVCSPSGEPCPIASNVLIALRNDPAWRGVVGYDEFRQVPMLLRKPPWANGGWRGPIEFSDADEDRVLIWVQQHGIHCRPEAVRSALRVAIDDNSYHPVREYLEGLRWDRQERLSSWLTYYLGVAPLVNYTEIVGRKWLISAVARILNPGCSSKYTLILEGPQDIGKSRALGILGGEWYTDDISQLGTKDSAMQAGSAWIIELAELDSTRKADINTIKAFISRQVDRFRKPFDRRVLPHPRQCVFAGTVNPIGEYLSDPTGAVRFWSVLCTAIDIAALTADRDQLWAEAVNCYREGEHWWLEDTEAVAAALVEQEARYAADTWEHTIGRWLDGNPMVDRVTVSEILFSVFEIPPAEHDRSKQTRVGTALHLLGWLGPKRSRIDGKPGPRYYFRPTAE